MYKNEITSKFGNDYLENGNEIRYCCPFCEHRRGKADTDYKLYANRTSGLFYCFKCGAKGYLGEKKEKSYKTAIDVYSRISDLYSEDIIVDNKNENVFYITDNKIEKGTVAYDYCINRNITEEKIKYYDLRLGDDDLFGRIIIPNETYGVRGIWCDTFSARSYIGQIPKYKNPVGVKKSEIVFNLHRIEKGVGDIYGVEGAITAICAGKEAVAFYGCCPSDKQIQMVASKNPKNFYAVLDNDEAGRPNNIKLAEKMSKLIDGNVYIVYMPEGKDASDLGEYEFKKYCNENKIEFVSGAYKSIIDYYET